MSWCERWRQQPLPTHVSAVWINLQTPSAKSQGGGGGEYAYLTKQYAFSTFLVQHDAQYYTLPLGLKIHHLFQLNQTGNWFRSFQCQGYFSIKIIAQEWVFIWEKEWSKQRFTWSFISIIPPLDWMVQISRCLFMAITRRPSITRSSRSLGSTNK